jgi:CRISPR-associated endonuclease Csn1
MMPKKTNGYILGLDIGITSVGWGIIKNDSFDIIDYGVRLFEEGSADANAKRREKRGSRRLVRRRKQRISDIKRLLVKNEIIDKNFVRVDNPYELRIKGLNSKLTGDELATALLHIAKRRGSGLDIVDDEEEKQTPKKDNNTLNISTKAALSFNESKLSESGLFVCQMQMQNLIQNGVIRNHSNVYRQKDYLREVKQILSNQMLSSSVVEQIIKILFRSRDYSEGPGSYLSPTPYGRYRLIKGVVNKEPLNLIELMRGKCSVYPDEFRAPKMSYSADMYNFLNDLNNLKIKQETKVSNEQKRYIIDNFINIKGKISTKELLKVLDLTSLSDLSGFREDESGKPIFTDFKGYQKILAATKEMNCNFVEDKSNVDNIIDILTKTKIVSERIKDLQLILPAANKLELNAIASIAGISGYHSLSLKAIKEYINEMLESNLNQMQIASQNEIFSSKFTEMIGKTTIPYNNEAILSPITKRAFRQTLIIVNLLRKKYGEFQHIIIETAREKNSDEERKKIQKIQKANTEHKQFVENLLLNNQINPDTINSKTKLKIRLYEEQNGKCIYSGNNIDLSRLINDPSAYEIEHIIPYSVSFDDSLRNKALAESSANYEKGNQTPYMYFKSGKAYGKIRTYEDFKITVLNNPNLRDKKDNLLFEKQIDKFSNIEDFINRNLVDTRYATRSIMQMIMEYEKANDNLTIVTGIRGKITDAFRKRAHLEKNRDEYMHHAIDALIIARLSIKSAIASLMAIREKKISNEVTYFLQDTGEEFQIDLIDDKILDDEDLILYMKRLKQIQAKDVKFSHKIDRKPNRQISDETLYGTRIYNNDEYVIKKYKDIYGKDGVKIAEKIRSGKPESLLIYRLDSMNHQLDNPNCNYNIVAKIVESYPNEKNPFVKYKEENGFIRKYAKNGKGPIIKQLKYSDGKLGSHLNVSQKYPSGNRVVLLQITPYRTDFYLSNNGLYKFVTVRRHDISLIEGEYQIDLKKYIEKKAEKKIDNNYIFAFSLNRNEVFGITQKNKDGTFSLLFYRFVATNNDESNVIEVKSIEHKDRNEYSDIENNDEGIKPKIKQVFITIGKSVVSLAKYAVSPIGEMQKCDKENLKFKI